jgi:hypothetical protein
MAQPYGFQHFLLDILGTENSVVIHFTKKSGSFVMLSLTGRVLKFIVLNTKEI